MPRTQLEQTFIADHRRMTKSFQALIAAVESNDLMAIHSNAAELDRVAGPHIEFEEHVLYPHVEDDRGTDFGATLRREHQVARSALLFLQDHANKSLRPEDRARVLEQLRVGFDHAVACGALLSHLTVLDEAQQAEMLERLQSFRDRQLRWTELDGRLKSDPISSPLKT